MANAEQLRALSRSAEDYRPELAQGVAFAAKARLRAGNPTPDAEIACRTICGLSIQEAAALTDETLEGLSTDGETPSYEVWRRRIRERFRAQNAERSVVS